MTRAPRSASCRVANGAAIACSSVTTVMPLSGCIFVVSGFACESAQDGSRVHRQPALVIGGPKSNGLAIGLRLPADVEGVEVEGRANGLEAEARHVGTGHLAPQQVHQQRGDQRAVHDQAGVALL